jgi:deoxyribose-phosphate aldolase
MTHPIARTIDHTLLKPEATPAQIEALCAEALRYEFASVCINPLYVPLAARLLQGSSVAICTVIGFPLGANRTTTKQFEARQALADGARELDMVLAIGRLKSGDLEYVEADIRALAEVAHSAGAIVKVILETALLTREEKIAACNLAVAARADFVKTSTGFSTAGATVEDVALMRTTVGPGVGVKAAGGVRSLQDAQAMLAAGATRLGSSSGARIVEEALGAETSAAGAEGY